MKEVGKVPPRHVALPLLAHVLVVVRPEQLHAHNGEDEDDDTQDEGLKVSVVEGRHHAQIWTFVEAKIV